MNQLSNLRNSQNPPWRIPDAAWLGLLLAVGALFAGRVLSFQFHGKGLSQLWAAINQPWMQVWETSTAAPLATFLHRLHYLVLGADPHHHYVILSVWWLAAVGLLFCWARRESSLLSGALAGVFFLSLPAASSALFSTGGLPLIVGAVLQLVLLIYFREVMARPSFGRVCGAILLFGLAVSLKPFALLFLPLACAAIALMEDGASLVRRWMFAAAVVVLALVFALSVPAIRELLTAPQTIVLEEIHWFEEWAHHASVLWPGWIAKWTGFLFITYALIRSGEAGLWGLGFFVPAAAVIYFASRYYHLSPKEAYAIALMLYVNWLWLTPWRRLAAPALVWLLFSFWSLPFQSDSSAAGLDAALALAFTLGVIARPVALKGWAALRSGKRIFRNAINILLALGLPFALAVTLSHTYERHASLARTELLSRHQPLALLIDQVKRDITPFSSYPVYAILGDHKNLETAVAVALFADPQYELFEGARPSNTRRLEAVLGAPYALSPKPSALNLWVTPKAPPRTITWNDPYFMPERWTDYSVSECDTTNGWTSNGSMSVSHNSAAFGIGEHAIRLRLPESLETPTFRYQSDLRGAMLIGSTDYVMTFWVRTDRWDVLEDMQVRLFQHDESWHWSEIALDEALIRSGWRRILLRASGASKVRIPEAIHSRITLQWSIDTPMDRGFGLLEIEIDDIRLWKRR